MEEAGDGDAQDASARPRVGVSSCLLGEPARFNGGHSRCRFLSEELTGTSSRPSRQAAESAASPAVPPAGSHPTTGAAACSRSG
jgi:hypothetical protein